MEGTLQEQTVKIALVDHSSRQTRREFCACACQAASLLAVGALAGCGGSSSPTNPTDAPMMSVVPSTLSGRVISITVDSASPLSAVGSAAMAQTSLGIFLVAHTGQDAFTALTSVCTHEGCTVTGFANNRYVCPCHGSQYTTSGTVVQGPAPRSLQQFPTQFANGVLTVTV
jgi:cytochrome b6-f complex iron-sulfur subunit